MKCNACGGTGAKHGWMKPHWKADPRVPRCRKCNGKGTLPDAKDLVLERGKSGLHESIKQYLEVEGCLVIDFTQGERTVYRALRRNPHGKGFCDLLVIVPAHRMWCVQLRNYRTLNSAREEVYLHCGFDHATPLALEIKRPNRGRLRLEQKLFQKRCVELGLPHAFVTSLEDVKKLIPAKLPERR